MSNLNPTTVPSSLLVAITNELLKHVDGSKIAFLTSGTAAIPITSLPADKVECPICGDKFDGMTVKPRKILHVLCEHIFCETCLATNVLQVPELNCNKCPLCRTVVFKHNHTVSSVAIANNGGFIVSHEERPGTPPPSPPDIPPEDAPTPPEMIVEEMVPPPNAIPAAGLFSSAQGLFRSVSTAALATARGTAHVVGQASATVRAATSVPVPGAQNGAIGASLDDGYGGMDGLDFHSESDEMSDNEHLI